MSEAKPEFTPAQIAEMSQYYETKARSYERFLGCAFAVVALLACAQIFSLSLVAAYFFGRM